MFEKFMMAVSKDKSPGLYDLRSFGLDDIWIANFSHYYLQASFIIDNSVFIMQTCVFGV